MKGSKYLDEDIEQALALLSSGESKAQVSKKLNIPKNTLWYWQHRATRFDEDFVAERERQKIMLAEKCWKIASTSIDVLDKRISNVKKNNTKVSDTINFITASDLPEELKDHLITMYKRENTMTVNELLKSSKDMFDIHNNLSFDSISSAMDNPVIVMPEIGILEELNE